MPYTSLDHFIARLRFKAAYPHIRKGARVCDLGCDWTLRFWISPPTHAYASA